MKTLLGTFLFYGAICGTSFAELKWNSTGPGGGGAFASPSIGPRGDVIIGSDLSGAYRSVDGGQSWSIIGYKNGLQSTHVGGVAHNASVDGTVFLATDNGIYRSLDCGSDQASPCSFERKSKGAITTVVAADSGNAVNSVIYAAGLSTYCQAPSYVWQSLDNGGNWTQTRGMGLPDWANIMALRVAPGDSTTVIAISSPERFSGPKTCGAERWPTPAKKRAFISKNGGKSFVEMAAGLGDVEDAKFDLKHPNRVWLTVTSNAWDNPGSLWMSDGNSGVGENFILQSDQHSGQIWPLSNGRVRLLDYYRQQIWQNTPNREFDRTGLWEFDDIEKSFTHVTSKENYDSWDLGWDGQVHSPMGSLNGHMQSFAHTNDDEAWWVDMQFAFKTLDGGKIFNQQFTKAQADGSFASRKLDNAVPGVLAPSPVSSNILYAGYFDMGCWRSANALEGANSVSWTDCNGPKSEFDQATQKTLFSPLNGWWLGYGGNTTAIAPDPFDSARVWAVHSRSNYLQGEAPDGLYRVASSFDNFNSWVDHTGNLPDLSQSAAISGLVVTAPNKDERNLWALAGNQLFELSNGQAMWRRQETPCDGGAIVLAGQGANLLVGGSTGVCWSHDFGITWQQAAGVPTFIKRPKTWWGSFDGSPHGTSDFAFDPQDGKHVYMTVMMPDYTKNNPDAGLYKSRDGGKSWKKVESFPRGNLERNFLRTVAVNPRNSNMIVVGTSPASVAGGYVSALKQSGAWISRNGGKSWKLENDGLAWPFMTRLRFLSPKRLYGISPGQGLVYTDIN